MSGHQKANCWKLNLELRPRKDKRIAHVLMKEEILLAKQEEHCEGKKPEVDVTTSLYFASINVIIHVEMMTCYNIIFVQHHVCSCSYEYVISQSPFL
jgi:hypothetical protein